MLATHRLSAYFRLMRFNRPIGTLLLLWPTLWALWLAAEGVPPIELLLVFIAGVVLMRAAGCVINDFADRRVDGQVKRTKQRPLVTGEISPNEAVALFVILSLCAFVLVLQTNALTIKLSFGGILLAFCYPFMKRYTHLPQIVLGAAFAWAVPMAFAAQTNEILANSWLVYTVVVVWTVAFDTQYAMVDRDDDLQLGVKSTAILFGDQDKFMIALLQSIVIIALCLVGQRFSLGWPYYLSVIAAGALFCYQSWLIRHRQRDACFQAFLNNNWVGMVIFVGITCDYLSK